MENFTEKTTDLVCAAPMVAFASAGELRATGLSVGDHSSFVRPISTGGASGHLAWSDMV